MTATWANGSSSCYDEASLPSVSRVEVLDGKIIAYLTSSDATAEAVIFDPAKGWRRLGARPCQRCDLPKSSCGHGKLTIKLSTESAKALRSDWRWPDVNEEATSCHEDRDTLWFSIGYYQGEGMGGVGGIGRKKGGAIEYRWPKELRESSVGPILYDRGQIWAGTYHSHECTGYIAAKGLVVYDWNTDTLDTFIGKDAGPCGSIVHDLLLYDGKIWVATDLGLSSFDKKTKVWDNFSPGKDGEPAMYKVQCDALYNAVLWDLVRVPTKGYENFNSYYEMLTEGLRKIKPKQRFPEISNLEASPRPNLGPK